MVGFVGVRNAIPAQPEVQGQAVVDAPVVLDVQGWRDVVPLTVDLVAIFCVLLGETHEVVSEVESARQRWGRYASRRTGERPVKLEVALRVRERVLPLLVNRPAKAELQLMGALGPRDVVAELVVIGFVYPRCPVGTVLTAGDTCQLDLRNAVISIGSAE